MTYSEKLKDPRWQRKRLEIMQRDDFKCVRCEKSDSTLHTHHKIYRYGLDPWDYPSTTLETVCQDCHADADEQRPYFDEEAWRLRVYLVVNDIDPHDVRVLIREMLLAKKSVLVHASEFYEQRAGGADAIQ